jgi:PAS domain S-box-containing protein
MESSATPTEGTRVRRRLLLGLGARMALVMGIAVVAVVIAVGSLTISAFRRTLVANEKQEAAVGTLDLAEDFALGLTELREDALFLAGTPPIAGIMRATDNDGVDPVDGSELEIWRQRLASIFTALISAKRGYVQLRFVGAANAGREIVRVDRDLTDGHVRTVPDNALQSKGERAYFIAAQRLAPGDVYLSRMELNQEHGRYSRPYLPVVRAVVPVFESSGEFFGAVIINLDLRVPFARIASRTTDRRTPYVADSGGHLLWAPDVSPESFMRDGLHATLTDFFPGLDLDLGAGESRAQTIGAGTDRQAMTLYRIAVDPARPDNDLYFLQAGSEAEVTAAASTSMHNAITAGALVLAVSLLLVTVFARSLTRPLREMAGSIEAFAHGHEPLGLPTDRADEVGELARSFQRMALNIKEAMSALAESERRLAVTLEAAQVGLWSWTFDGDVIEWDPTMRRIFGVAQDAHLDDVRGSWSNIHEDDLPALERAVQEAIAGTAPFNVSYRVMHESGEVRYVSSSGHVIRDEDGKPVRFIGACKDVTLAQRSERLAQHARELARSNAALEEFAHVASHDLQEPLRTVSSYVELLGRRYKGKLDSDADEFIAYAVDGARRMHTLIENLLEYSRVGSRGKSLEPVDMAAILDEVTKGLEAGLHEAGAEIIVEGDLPRVSGDANQLRQLLQNLIANAVKFRGSRKPRIRIQATPLGDEWHFRVSDNGIGIEPRFAERIFVIFQRLHSRDSYPGTGIGLALCRRIVDRHGGRIWVDSIPGEGSTFSFTLPSAINEWERDADESDGQTERRRNLAGG